MTKSKLLLWSVLNALGTLVYTAAVAWLMYNGNNLFGQITGFWGPLAILLLFVFSALTVGLLVLGRPIYLYLNGAKSDAIKLLLYTAGWLFLIVVIIFALLVALRK